MIIPEALSLTCRRPVNPVDSDVSWVFNSPDLVFIVVKLPGPKYRERCPIHERRKGMDDAVSTDLLAHILLTKANEYVARSLVHRI